VAGASPHFEQDDSAALRAAGLRVTAARLAVLDAARHGDHLTVDEIAAAARRRIGSVSTQAVYDVLAALARAGLVQRIELAGGPARFETRVGDNHHHLACRSCGLVVDVDCAVGHAPCLDPSTTAGFVVDEADVTYWGLCPACASATDPPSERSTHG
jgi:Fur family ferric uptake transcriptional regulator